MQLFVVRDKSLFNAEIKGATLNSSGSGHAAALIRAGKIKDSASWNPPSSEEENSYVNANSIQDYGTWHLGIDRSATEGTKGRYKFIFTSDFKTVDLAGLRACITRAAGAGYSDIESRAQSLYDDAKAKVGKQSADTDFANLKRFDAGISLEAPDAKSFVAIKDANDNISDYANVRIKGYLSTFKGTTESDRQGDYVEPGAFTETIKNFMAKNPVMLRDHVNMTGYLAGSFTKMAEDQKGLAIEAALSNSPDNKDTRFKVAESHLRTLSMGGLFHYKEDGRGIFKVDLWEGSLTPIPANPDANFSVRSLNDEEKLFVKSAGRFPSFLEFRKAMQMH